jgi:hypothetical protein
MKPIAFVTIPLLLANHAAFAGSIDGNGALALAALVAEPSPNVPASEKIVLGKFLNGQTSVPYAPNKKITVAAGAVTCRASNVDITLHSYDLMFEAKKVAMHGRKAHELYATLAEVGVPPDGAAGSIFEAVSNLDCAIDPGEVKQKRRRRRALHICPGEMTLAYSSPAAMVLSLILGDGTPISAGAAPHTGGATIDGGFRQVERFRAPSFTRRSWWL